MGTIPSVMVTTRARLPAPAIILAIQPSSVRPFIRMSDARAASCTSAGVGSCMCGSLPRGTMERTSSSPPLMTSAMSAKIEVVATTSGCAGTWPATRGTHHSHSKHIKNHRIDTFFYPITTRSQAIITVAITDNEFFPNNYPLTSKCCATLCETTRSSPCGRASRKDKS